MIWYMELTKVSKQIKRTENREKRIRMNEGKKKEKEEEEEEWLVNLKYHNTYLVRVNLGILKVLRCKSFK